MYLKKPKVDSNIIFICFLVSTIASLGSLFFSEIMNFVPCSFCWYQRIFMYPLVFIFLVNLLYPDDYVIKYSIILVIIGLCFSIYHNLLMFGIIPEKIVPCVNGIPCSTVYINWFGFVTIPFLSMLSYIILFVLLILAYKGNRE